MIKQWNVDCYNLLYSEFTLIYFKDIKYKLPNYFYSKTFTLREIIKLFLYRWAAYTQITPWHIHRYFRYCSFKIFSWVKKISMSTCRTLHWNVFSTGKIKDFQQYYIKEFEITSQNDLYYILLTLNMKSMM